MPAKPQSDGVSISAFAPLHVWARLLAECGGAAPEHRRRLRRSLMASALFAPWRLAEHPLYALRVARTPIDPSPVFVLGLPRSGTTHLHNIMANDPRLGTLTQVQAVAPSLFLAAGWLVRRILDGQEAEGANKRSFDNVTYSSDSPQEEEVAMANLTHRSVMHIITYPQHHRYLHHRYATLEALSPRELAHWDRLYLTILRKATWAAGGRRLVLKSPINIVRIPHLLRLFPQARFVHIVRNPYTIYPSLMNFHTKSFAARAIGAIPDPEQTRLNVEDLYAQMARKYLQDKSLIPADRFVEVRYEDLSREPLPQLERIYAQLDLPGWDDARAPMAAYLDGLKDYRKNKYPEDPAVIERVGRCWKFAAEAWGYAPPDAEPMP